MASTATSVSMIACSSSSFSSSSKRFEKSKSQQKKFSIVRQKSSSSSSKSSSLSSFALNARRKKDEDVSVDAEILDAVDDKKSSGKNNNGVSIAKVINGSSSSSEATFRSLRDGALDDDNMIDTVQVVTVRFQIKMEVGFGDVMRICGSHESMGEWDVANALLLNWSEGNVWTSEEIELPVDGIYIYKYCVAPASNPNAPSSWQSGNNQVLSLSPEDGPILYVKDSWSGNPNETAVFSAEGVKQSKDERLVERVRKQDETVKRQTGEIKVLRTELKTSKMQVKALREEARLSANVRIALKDQLNAEKKRNLVFEEQVGAWKKRFMQITGNGDKEDKKSSKQESR
ncbi:unnamed protein product [Bathycoccus prasinos]